MSSSPEDRVRTSFAKQAAMSLIGAEISSVKRGEVVLTLAHRPELTQQHGYLHAGVVTTLLDSAAGYAALTTMPDGKEVVSVEFKVNMLAPAVGERLRAVGQVRRAGKTITVVTAEAFALKDGQEKLVALMQATMYAVG